MSEGRSEGPAPLPETSTTPTECSGPAAPAGARSRLRTTPSRQTPRRRGLIATLFRGVANIVFVGLVIYLTYFFTLFFSTRPVAPTPVPEDVRAAAKKIEEQKAEERKLLTTYGPVNPVTKTVRIPVDRAMQVMAAESAQPALPKAAVPKPAAAAATTTAGTGAPAAIPKAEPAAATTNAATPAGPIAAAAPAPAPARAGMAPADLYRAICIACHDVDGKGTIVRRAMPMIPDLTDAKWQATRTDADLLNSVLVGKGQFMLPMKDKFELAQTDPKAMVAFMRSFQTGKQIVEAGPPPPSAVFVALGPSVALAPSTPFAAAAAATNLAAPAAPPPTLTPAPAASAPTYFAPAIPAQESQPTVSSLTALGPAPALARAPSTASSPEQAARIRAAADLYRTNCLACHGQDGRGTAVRFAMPLIPDFTTREWQTARGNPQLAVSILEGRGAFMPPWRGRISPDLAQDLVAYVRTFGPTGLLASTAPTGAFSSRFKQLQQQWDEINTQIQALARP
jgi:mono/diheme cytochrome c family protein